jgi:hypothetical protein
MLWKKTSNEENITRNEGNKSHRLHLRGSFLVLPSFDDY